MPKTLRLVIAGAALALLAIQFVPVARTNPSEDAPLRAPADIAAVLDRCCADCHSTRTRWPWYAHVAPASWLVGRDVRVGRQNLNFSYWADLPASEQRIKAKQIMDQLAMRAMPVRQYLILHPKARPTAGEIERLRAWFSGPAATPGSKADSLPPPGVDSFDEMN